MDVEDWQRVGVDPTVPNVARIYDYYLGGKDNFAADRVAGDKVLSADPHIQTALLANRSFLMRVVRYLAMEAGIDQFIDLGTGLPTQNNVHQVAQSVNPLAKVVYVDYDPVVLVHARTMLAANEYVTAISADLRRPGEVLSHPELRGLIDFSRPVAVLMIAVLHFVDDAEDPAGIVAGYRKALVPGSYVAFSIGTSEGVDPAKIARIQDVYRDATEQITYRSREKIEELFGGLELVDPGLVRLPHWRPVSEPAARSENAGSEWLFGGIGRILN